MLIDLSGYGLMISKVILCLAVPGFASAPLLNHGIIIACRRELFQFPALCCFCCLHNSAESVPLEQGQLHADVTTTLPSPDYLSSRWATYWYSLKKPPKITEWLWNKSWSSDYLLTTYCFTFCSSWVIQHFNAYEQKDPHRDVPFLAWCRGNNC